MSGCMHGINVSGEVEDNGCLFSGEWYGVNPEVYELGFIDTPNPAATASRASVSPIVNGATGPLWNCSTGKLFLPCQLAS